MSEHDRAAEGRSEQLVFAIAHEVANLVLGIRFEAQALYEAQSERERARSSVSIDRLTVRTGALLAQLRPMLGALPVRERAAPAALFHALARTVDDVGTGGVELAFDPAPALPEVACAAQWLEALLSPLLLASIERARPKGRLQLSARAQAGRVDLSLELFGSEGSDLEDWREAALQGRVLLLATAEQVLGRIGGRVEVALRADGDRVSISLPVADPA